MSASKPTTGTTVYRFNLSLDFEVEAHKYVYHRDSPREQVPGMEGDFYKKAANYVDEWACYSWSRENKKWRLTGRTDTAIVETTLLNWYDTYEAARQASIRLLKDKIERLKVEAKKTAARLMAAEVATSWESEP